jgi:hypothetical protein
MWYKCVGDQLARVQLVPSRLLVLPAHAADGRHGVHTQAGWVVRTYMAVMCPPGPHVTPGRIPRSLQSGRGVQALRLPLPGAASDA